MKRVIWFLLACSPLPMLGSVEEARSVVQQWVATEKAISQEESAWKEKKETLDTLLLILEREKESLEKKIAEQRSLMTTGDNRREELLTEEKQLLAYRAQVEKFLSEIEGDLRGLKTVLPRPLQDKLESAWQRLPADSAKTTLGIAERMQTVAAILTEIQNFNATVTLSQELHTFADGSQGEVKTFYLGLGSAYYITPGGEDAGYGYPTPKGWQWVSMPELASTIDEAIAIYSFSSRDARFIPLPVKGLSKP